MSWNTARLQPWEAELCGCMDDSSSCITSFCVPCVQYGVNAEKIDGSDCCCAACLYCLCMYYGCACLLAAGKRTTLRYNYGLQEDCCCDCCVHCCCSCCALAQEARELQRRGPPPRHAMPMTQPGTILVDAVVAVPLPRQVVSGAGMRAAPMSAPYAVGADGVAYPVDSHGQPHMMQQMHAPAMPSPHPMQVGAYPMQRGPPPPYAAASADAHAMSLPQYAMSVPPPHYSTLPYPPTQYPPAFPEVEKQHVYR